MGSDNRKKNTNSNDEKWTFPVLLQTISTLTVLFGYLYYIISNNHEYPALIRKLITAIVAYCTVHILWYYIDFHKTFGPWKCSEPKSHLKFALKSSWIIALFSIGEISRKIFYYMDSSGYVVAEGTLDKVQKMVMWEFPDEYKLIKTSSLGEDIFWGVLGFYLIDFLRYWAHRCGHYSFFYKTFPFSHAHHHNQIFVNPLTTIMSPLLHLASIATYTPPFLLGAMGLHRAALISLIICSVPNWTQHLGFDPFPWLTRWNHYYFYGALPWIPLYHSYHHNPFIKTGNFGNTTVLFDYIFDTLQPECVYHIENGKPLEKVMKWFENEEKLDKILDSMYASEGGKNKMDLNRDGYDMSAEFFSLNYL